MYNHIKGRLVEKNPAYVVIEANGVGYLINISLHTYSKLPDSESVMLFTHIIVREDSWQLFGFAEKQEREAFKLLISVSGVGPNTGRIILSSLSAQEVESAILLENAPLLTSIKGIGAKTAQRIILDLKDKFGKGISTPTPISGGVNTASGRAEAVSALEILGFNRLQIEKAVNKLLQEEAELNVEEIVKRALKVL